MVHVVPPLIGVNSCQPMIRCRSAMGQWYNAGMKGNRFDEAKAICDHICDSFVAAEDGPAHVVISDYNFDNETIGFIRTRVVDLLRTEKGWEGLPFNAYELRATRDALDALLAIPEDERCCPDPEAA